MKDILRLMVSLGLVCAIGCAALVFVNERTKAPREAVEQAVLNDNLKLAVPAGLDCEFDAAKRLDYDKVTFHRAYRDGRLVALVAQTRGHGFGGRIYSLVGLDPASGAITRVLVTGHTETPGLGTQATDRKEQKSLWKASELQPGEVPPNAFLDRFTGKSGEASYVLGKPEPDKPGIIEGVSGATYSSKGVLQGVNRACKVFREHRAELLN